MQHSLQKSLSNLESIISIQLNCLSDNYMLGMANGLICAHSVLTGTNPAYVTKKSRANKTRVRHKKVKI